MYIHCYQTSKVFLGGDMVSGAKHFNPRITQLQQPDYTYKSSDVLGQIAPNVVGTKYKSG